MSLLLFVSDVRSGVFTQILVERYLMSRMLWIMWSTPSWGIPWVLTITLADTRHSTWIMTCIALSLSSIEVGRYARGFICNPEMPVQNHDTQGCTLSKIGIHHTRLPSSRRWFLLLLCFTKLLCKTTQHTLNLQRIRCILDNISWRFFYIMLLLTCKNNTPTLSECA